MRLTAPAKSVAPKTSMRGGGTKERDEDRDVVDPALAVRRRSGGCRSGRPPSIPRASASTAWSSPGSPSEPCAPSGVTTSSAPERRRPPDDGRERDRLVGEHAVEQRPSDGEVGGLHEHVEHAAAGEADGEGVVVAVAVALPLGLAAGEHVGRGLVDRALDAAAGDAADRLAVGAHGHRRAGRARRAAAGADDGGQAERGAGRDPGLQLRRRCHARTRSSRRASERARQDDVGQVL